MRYRWPAGAKLGGVSVGGRYTTLDALQAWYGPEDDYTDESDYDVDAVEWEIGFEY